MAHFTKRGAIGFRVELGGPGEVKACLVVSVPKLTASRERTLSAILAALPKSTRGEFKRLMRETKKDEEGR